MPAIANRDIQAGNPSDRMAMILVEIYIGRETMPMSPIGYSNCPGGHSGKTMIVPLRNFSAT